MRTTVDKAGRLVIPRALRGQIGLAEGGEVNVELDAAAIRIEPVSGADLREQEGLLVIPRVGSAIDASSVRELIDREREARG